MRHLSVLSEKLFVRTSKVTRLNTTSGKCPTSEFITPMKTLSGSFVYLGPSFKRTSLSWSVYTVMSYELSDSRHNTKDRSFTHIRHSVLPQIIVLFFVFLKSSV